jgi:hypothetical protein
MPEDEKGRFEKVVLPAHHILHEDLKPSPRNSKHPLFAEEWSGRVFNLLKVVSLDCVESLIVFENSSLAPWWGPVVGFLALPLISFSREATIAVRKMVPAWITARRTGRSMSNLIWL